MNGNDDLKDSQYEHIMRTLLGLKINQSAFLGGLTFAAMVFVMQAKEDFVFLKIYYYPDILITSLAGISLILILSSLDMMRVVSGGASSKSKSSKYANELAFVAILSFIVIIPFLLLPFSIPGAIFIGILEIVLVSIAVSKR